MSELPLQFYRQMATIRHFEETAIELYKEGLIGGSYHSYIGQEAVAVGVCSALRRQDYITTTYRGRGQHLAKGADPYRLFAEMLGRVDGYCQGKGGPMHITDLETGILGANGIVAAGIPISVGAALSAKMNKTDLVSVAFFGDGAVNQGVFSEALNLAALWELPVIFVCENNLYAEMTPLHRSGKTLDLVERARSFGIESVIVDGNDVEAIFNATKTAASRAQKGQGPTFLEAKTYRLHGHMHGDAEIYRTKEEVEEWRQKDPIGRWRKQLLSRKEASAKQLSEIDQTIATELKKAAEAARQNREPEAATITDDVF